jgi:hypothetical protein
MKCDETGQPLGTGLEVRFVPPGADANADVFVLAVVEFLVPTFTGVFFPFASEACFVIFWQYDRLLDTCRW